PRHCRGATTCSRRRQESEPGAAGVRAGPARRRCERQVTLPALALRRLLPTPRRATTALAETRYERTMQRELGFVIVFQECGGTVAGVQVGHGQLSILDGEFQAPGLVSEHPAFPLGLDPPVAVGLRPEPQYLLHAPSNVHPLLGQVGELFERAGGERDLVLGQRICGPG